MSDRHWTGLVVVWRSQLDRAWSGLRAMLMLVLAALVVQIAPPASVHADAGPLAAKFYETTQINHMGGTLLAGTTLTGNVSIYLDTHASLDYKSVTFLLDGVPFSTDSSYPFDFNGTTGCLGKINPCPNGSAILYDTTLLKQGSHTITAVALSLVSTATIPTVDASFTVNWPAGVIPRVYPAPVEGAVHTTMLDAAKFLYTGAYPSQTGVAAATIDPDRAAVIHGRALNADGSPLAGVLVTIAGHSEYGQTYSRADGGYDLAVNGGGALTVNLARAGYVTVQRTVTPGWQDWQTAAPARLLPLDTSSTTITPATLATGTFGVARGTAVSDAAGSRQSTLLVPAGTTAQLVMPDGSRQATSTLTVQQTEFTVGPNGHDAMPAPLPPSSAYTYAVDMSVAEMRNSGAVGVEFSQPVWHYNENFLNFPVGSVVPAGFYDYQQHAWKPSDSGLVVKVLAITAGRADLDVDGSGTAASTASYAAIGMTDGERAQLASLYPVGTSLWRVGMKHFCPWDMNWPFRLPPHAIDPWWKGLHDWFNKTLSDCLGIGSRIGCEDQSLGEQVPLIGSGTALSYSSTRVPDSHAQGIDVEVVPDTVPTGLNRVIVEAKVAGRSFVTTFDPPVARQRYTFAWDGKDEFGRQLNGSQPVTFLLTYVYQGQYATTTGASRFGEACKNPCVLAYVGADPTRAEISLQRSFQGHISSSVVADARGEGLGGWLLGMHHVLDPQSQTVGLGSGGTIKLAAFGASTYDLAGNGSVGATGDGGNATSASLNYPGGVAYDPSGNLYIADTLNDRIRKVTPAGIISTIAGTGTTGFSGDGGPATSAELHSPLELTVAPDGAVIFADVDNHRIRRISPAGVITTIAGDGSSGSSGDGGPATSATLREPVSVAVSPDGTLFIADYASHRIRRIAPDGIISTWAGTGTAGYSGDSDQATDARLNKPASLALDDQGTLFVADSANHVVRSITKDGVITTVAGSGTAGSSGDGGPATSAQLDGPVSLCLGPDGVLYIADRNALRIRRLNTDDTITTIAGDGAFGYVGGISAALGTPFATPRSIAISPTGALAVADAANHRVRRITPRPLGLVSGQYLVPSRDRSQVYVFDTTGRQLKTVDALTGVTVYTFGYDSLGRLAQVTDHDGNQITITHPDSTHVQIQAPDNNITTLTLDANGWATSLTTPSTLSYGASYSTGGLLRTFTDRRGHSSLFGYDSLGLLLQDTGRDGKTTTLTRTPLDSSVPETTDDGIPVVGTGYKVVLTTPMGRTTTHRVTFDGNDVMRRYITDETGDTQTQVVRPDGVSTATSKGGAQLTSVVMPDPRWGMVSPQPDHSIATSVGHSPVTTTTVQSITLTGNNPLDVATQTISQTQLGHTWTTSWTKSPSGSTLGTLISTTPQGRTQTTTINTDGRTSQTQAANLLPITYDYDSRGRPWKVTQGAGATQRQSITTYDAHGFPGTVQNPLLQTTTYTNDPLGQPTQVSGPAGTATTDYDDNGNPKTITPPGQPSYAIGYENDDRPNTFRLPDTDGNPNNDSYTYTLNDDLQYKDLTLPSGDTLAFGYDTGARATSITRTKAAGGSDSITFDWTGGHLASSTSADGVISTPSYTGAIPTATTWSGAGISGTVSTTPDDQMRPLTDSINGSNTISYTYDNDGLLASAGLVTLTHDPNTGQLSSYTVGTLSATTAHYTGFGEPDRLTTTQNGTTVYDLQIPSRDNVGRIATRNETVSGLSHTDVIDYWDTNRLKKITRDGTEISSYTYDTAGNLQTETHGASSITSTYDAQNRIVTRGTLTYEHNLDGELTKVTDSSTTPASVTTYGWKMGRLSSAIVTTPSGSTTVNYLYDAAGNRVGKKTNGVLDRIYLWAGGHLVAEADASGAILDRFVYATRGHTPDYMIRPEGGGVDTVYRMVTDERGSIRLVINQTTGTIIQQLDYDEWGRVTGDTRPGFQPLGYVGGLYDQVTHLVHFGARDYDPTSTQWLSRDSIGFGGGGNQYAYTDDDPINAIDPGGHSLGGCFADIEQGAKTAAHFVGVGLRAASDIFGLTYIYEQASQGHWGRALLGLALVVLPFGEEIGLAARAGRAVGDLVDVERAAEESDYLYRGVAGTHPGYSDAGQGIVRPRGGPASAAEHNSGDTRSEFTSWTTSPSIAQDFSYPGGVVLRIPRASVADRLVSSPDLFDESEILVRGPVFGASVM